MKQKISIVLIFALICTPYMSKEVYAKDVETEYITLDEIGNNKSEEAVIRITKEGIEELENKAKKDKDVYQDFMDDGGIIVLLKDGGEESLNSVLNVPFAPKNIEKDEKIEKLSKEGKSIKRDKGINVASVYYKNQGSFGVHEINIGSQDKFDYALVEEIIEDIRAKKLKTVNSAADSGTYLGEYEATSTREPKGKLSISYKFYTVQNYHSKDYYIVKANITGSPGYDLDGDYEDKYKGEKLQVSLEGISESVFRDAFGPTRTIKSSSYSVDIGASFGKTGVSLGLNYTRDIDDTEIDVSLSTSSAEWDVNLNKGAKKSSVNFEPRITFDCPENKPEVAIRTYVGYTVDSWNTFDEIIDRNKTFLLDANGFQIERASI